MLASAAVPLGIIATEFITNSFKYAFDGAPGTIGVRLEAVVDKVRLTLWDDGKGLPEDRQTGTGMQLVTGFARQLHADVDWEGQGGTRVSLTFPASAGAA